MRSSSIAIFVSLCLTPTVSAQGFNIDVGSSEAPANDYGAVTGQIGYWNLISAAAAGTPLNDLAGLPTSATVACSPPGTNISFHTAGRGREALLRDLQDLGTSFTGTLYTWTVSGIANDNYRVTFYSTSQNGFYFGTTEITLIGGAAGPQPCTEPYADYGKYSYGRSFLQDTVTVTSGTLSWTMRATNGDGEFNGVQIEPIVPGEIQPYCDVSGNSHGCNQFIYATGSSSLAANTLRVKAAQVISNKTGILFWGRTIGGDLPRCVTPPFKRTPVQDSGGNPPPDDCSGEYSFHWSAAYSASVGVGPGDTVYCQYYWRDPGSVNTAAWTDGLAVTFAP